MWHGVVFSHASTTSTLAINIGFALPGGLVMMCYAGIIIIIKCCMEPTASCSYINNSVEQGWHVVGSSTKY